jgi:heat shock protein HslJ
MSGPVRLHGGLLALPESLAMTEMGCEPALIARDRWLETFLSRQPLYDITGARLVLTRAGTFVEAAAPRTPPGGEAGGGTDQRVGTG